MISVYLTSCRYESQVSVRPNNFFVKKIVNAVLPIHSVFDISTANK